MFVIHVCIIQIYSFNLNWYKKKNLFRNSPSLVLKSCDLLFFLLPAMCSVSFYSEISLRFQLNLPSLRMHCNTPRGSLRTDSLEKQGSHSWPVTMEADAVFFLPCLPLCSLELLPIVKRGYASILLHHDRTCLFFKGHEAAGHWSRLFARSREQP